MHISLELGITFQLDLLLRTKSRQSYLNSSDKLNTIKIKSKTWFRFLEDSSFSVIHSYRKFNHCWLKQVVSLFVSHCTKNQGDHVLTLNQVINFIEGKPLFTQFQEGGCVIIIFLELLLNYSLDDKTTF